VHSSKDLPARLPDGLVIGAVLPREDPRDAVILPAGQAAVADVAALSDRLGVSPVIGTSSIRRIAQLRQVWPGARFLPIRGNLDTRLRKLDGDDYHALVLAAAGMRRLQHGDRLSALLPVNVCVPAPGQGIIAVEVRQDDNAALEAVARFDHRDAALALRAERAVVERLGGGCQMPLGAYASVAADRLVVESIVIAPDASRLARATASGDAGMPEQIGAQAAEALLAQGAASILAAAANDAPVPEGH
jgi:hydroxymethylbilane synthase